MFDEETDEDVRHYPIDLRRVFGPGSEGVMFWINHIAVKSWPEHEKHDLQRALDAMVTAAEGLL